ncbi:MAG: carotenoid oxygenase family protein [Myxococcota bacterium]
MFVRPIRLFRHRVFMVDLCRIVTRLFESVVRESRDEPLPCLEGRLPAGLRGVLFRNGPGRFERGGHRYGHPFDGDGMVSRFAFDGGGVRYSNRFVQTRELLAEERADTLLYRGFGTLRPGGWWRNALRMRFKNAANTNVIAHAGKLLALWEGGWPHELDPQTLATRGRYSFGGKLENRFSAVERLINPELPFSAHPKWDPDTGHLHNFGLAFGRKNRLLLYDVDTRGHMAEPRIEELPALSFAHDFALTRNYWVFLLPAVEFRIARTLWGTSSPVGALSADSRRPMQVLLVPRHGGPSRMFDAIPGFAFHLAGAYENARGEVVVDAMVMDRFPDLSRPEDMVSPEVCESDGVGRGLATPTRLYCDPTRGHVSASVLAPFSVETPTVAPQQTGWYRDRHRVIWGTATAPGMKIPFYSSLCRIDLTTGQHVTRDLFPNLPSEPIPIAAPGARSAEQRGWLAVPVYIADAHVTDLLIVDATTLATVARFRLPHHLPHDFHGGFVSHQRYQDMFGAGVASTEPLAQVA